MYKIKPEFENKIINLYKNGKEFRFDTTIAYTQYQLHNMYNLNMYSKYIDHVNELLPIPVDITSKLELEYVKLPKQDSAAKPESKPKTEKKPKQKRTKKAEVIVEETKCEGCNENPCVCTDPAIEM